MLTRSATGTWLPAWVPRSTSVLATLLLTCSMAQTATNGCDGTMLNGFNILPAYNQYFKLTDATRGLNTASIFIGGFVGLFWAGKMADSLGRRPALFWGSLISIVGIVLQTAAQDITMFVVARIVLGFGGAIGCVAGAVYLNETFPSRWRAWGVGLLNNTYYVGAFLAALVTLGASHIGSSWAWRVPSLFQAVFSVLCLIVLPFVPESPRWLVAQGLYAEARVGVAQTNFNSDTEHPDCTTIYESIVNALEWERKQGQTISWKEIYRTPTARKRVLIGASVGPFSCIAGNVIATYYLGAELTTAGITDSQDQLKANIVMNVWCFACSLFGTRLLSSWGRKPTALLSQGLLIVLLCIIGGLTKKVQDYKGSNEPHSLTYGAVAAMFLFQGFYSIAWTPLLYVYPPEIMNYAIRANGLALSTLTLNFLAIVLVFSMPVALKNLGWKMYIINGSWDIITFFLIAIYWVESKGKTLEEVDALFGDEPSPAHPLGSLDIGKSLVEESPKKTVDESLATEGPSEIHQIT